MSSMRLTPGLISVESVDASSLTGGGGCATTLCPVSFHSESAAIVMESESVEMTEKGKREKSIG
jgi:hypothetical protein